MMVSNDKFYHYVSLLQGKIQATGKLEDVKKEIDMNDFLSTPMQNLMVC